MKMGNCFESPVKKGNNQENKTYIPFISEILSVSPIRSDETRNVPHDNTPNQARARSSGRRNAEGASLNDTANQNRVTIDESHNNIPNHIKIMIDEHRILISSLPPIVNNSKRAQVPSKTRDDLWATYVGITDEGKCPACLKIIYHPGASWHASHIISDADMGTVQFENLRVLCATCNIRMKKNHMISYYKDDPDILYRLYLSRRVPVKVDGKNLRKYIKEKDLKENDNRKNRPR